MAKIEHKLYGGEEVIYFDDERHIFTDKKGNNIISVTGITGVIDKSGALMGWTAKMMGLYLAELLDKGVVIDIGHIEIAKKEYRRLKQEAADIGTLIHEWAEKWITLKKEPELPEDERVRNGSIAFLKWVKDTGVKFNNSEQIIYSKKYNYAGIMDADGHIDGKHCIIDFKSSNGLYNEYKYQLAGYWQAKEEETNKKYEIGYLVRFGKDDGEFEVKEISRSEYEKDKKAFLGALAIKRRESEIKNGK